VCFNSAVAAMDVCGKPRDRSPGFADLISSTTSLPALPSPAVAAGGELTASANTTATRQAVYTFYSRRAQVRHQPACHFAGLRPPFIAARTRRVRVQNHPTPGLPAASLGHGLPSLHRGVRSFCCSFSISLPATSPNCILPELHRGVSSCSIRLPTGLRSVHSLLATGTGKLLGASRQYALPTHAV
jgi:hypothetical protein